MIARNAQHARRRPFPWGAAVAGLLVGAFVGSVLGAWAWDVLS